MLVLVVGLEVGDVDEGVSLTVAGGTAVVVTVDVDVDVETEVLETLAGLITPHAIRRSEFAVFCTPMSAPWCSTMEEPSGPLSWSAVKPSVVATNLPDPSERTSNGGRSPLAGCSVCPGTCK